MKNKLYIYILVGLSMVFVNINNVNAATKCYYNLASNDRIEITIDDIGSPNYVGTGIFDYIYPSNSFTQYVQSTKKCPSIIYYGTKSRVTQGGNSYDISNNRSDVDTNIISYVGSISLGNKPSSNTHGGGTGVSFSNYFSGVSGTGVCEAYFGKANEKGTFLHAMKEYVFKPIKIAVPIILLVLTTLDFSKVIFSNGKDGMEKAKSNFVKRSLIAVCIFFIPDILSLLMTLVDMNRVSSCIEAMKLK